MTTEILKALVSTVIKQSTIDSTKITDPKQKFSLDAGDEVEINSYESAADNHWKLALTSPVNGVTQWFAYKPHVTISDLGNEYTKTIYPGLVLNAYQKLEHALETEADRKLSEEDGRKLFEAGILPILQSENTFKRANAEGEQILAKLVSQNQDHYSINKAPCAYSVSCVMKYIAENLGFATVKNLFQDPCLLDNVQVTGVEKKLRRLGFHYFLKKDYLAPRGAIGARWPRNGNDQSGHIYFITKDGEKRTKFPNPENSWDDGQGKHEKGINGAKWQIKDLHAENLHFFDHVFMQWLDGYTDGFWLPPGIYPLKR
jgi:hypothetical protein